MERGRGRERVTVHQLDLSIHLLGCMISRKLTFTNQIINSAQSVTGILVCESIIQYTIEKIIVPILLT